jgi:hypothetical protein
MHSNFQGTTYKVTLSLSKNKINHGVFESVNAHFSVGNTNRQTDSLETYLQESMT